MATITSHFKEWIEHAPITSEFRSKAGNKPDDRFAPTEKKLLYGMGVLVGGSIAALFILGSLDMIHPVVSHVDSARNLVIRP